MVKAIEKGYIQKEILNTAYEYQLNVENQKEIVVGVNKFQTDEDAEKEILEFDPEIEDRQKEKLKTLKEKRDQNTVKEALEKLKKAAKEDDNIMPYVLDAVKHYATVGEISSALRDVFGEYTEAIIL
jgi:methylmalonyl-CoA mutase N-terminal domain/subunit